VLRPQTRRHPVQAPHGACSLCLCGIAPACPPQSRATPPPAPWASWISQRVRQSAPARRTAVRATLLRGPVHGGTGSLGRPPGSAPAIPSSLCCSTARPQLPGRLPAPRGPPAMRLPRPRPGALRQRNKRRFPENAGVRRRAHRRSNTRLAPHSLRIPTVLPLEAFRL